MFIKSQNERNAAAVGRINTGAHYVGNLLSFPRGWVSLSAALCLGEAGGGFALNDAVLPGGGGIMTPFLALPERGDMGSAEIWLAQTWLYLNTMQHTP